jgi:hypothetical protein
VKNLFTAALLLALLAPAAPGASAQTAPAAAAQAAPAAPDEGRRVKALAKVLEAGRYEDIMEPGRYKEVASAIREAGRPKSEKVARFLLKRLKQNLSRKMGHYQPAWSRSDGDLFLWGTMPSENDLLVWALAEQGYVATVPTLRRMLTMKPDRRGVLAANLAYHINRLTGEMVEYEDGGVWKRLPALAPKP